MNSTIKSINLYRSKVSRRTLQCQTSYCSTQLPRGKHTVIAGSTTSRHCRRTFVSASNKAKSNKRDNVVGTIEVEPVTSIGNNRSWLSYRNVALGGALIIAAGTGSNLVTPTSSESFSSSSNSPGNRNDVVVTDIEAELIARQLQPLINIPGIPDIIERPLLEQFIKLFIKACPLVLPEGVFNKLLSGEGGVQGLEESVILEIANHVYIPLLSQETTHHLVETLCSVLFTDQSFETVRRQMMARSLRHVMNKESRRDLATELNKMVDLPLVGEETEQMLAEQIVNKSFALLESVIPKPILDVLDSTSPEELKFIRNNLVDRLNEKIDIPSTSEEEEKMIFRFLVDCFLSFYGLEDGTKNEDEMLEEVRHKLKIAEIELEAHQETSFDKEQKMKRTIEELKQSEKDLLKQLKKDGRGKSWLGFLKFWGK